MEMASISSHISTVRRGHYGLVDTSLKLQILRELVDEAIATTAVKEKLDERIDQQQALAAEKREIARKNKEEQKQKLIMEGATEKEMNQTNAEQDGNENVNGQLVAKEGKEIKNAPASKMGDAKLYPVRTYIIIPHKFNPCNLLCTHVNSCICISLLKLLMTVLLSAYRGGIVVQKCWTNQYELVLLEKTDSITGIGFLGVKEDFLSKMQIPKSGGTIAPRKR